MSGHVHTNRTDCIFQVSVQLVCSVDWMQFLASICLNLVHRINDPDKFVEASWWCNCRAFMRRWKAMCNHVILILSLVSDFKCDPLNIINSSKLLLDQSKKFYRSNQKMLRSIHSKWTVTEHNHRLTLKMNISNL